MTSFLLDAASFSMASNASFWAPNTRAFSSLAAIKLGSGTPCKLMLVTNDSFLSLSLHVVSTSCGYLGPTRGEMYPTLRAAIAVKLLSISQAISSNVGEMSTDQVQVVVAGEADEEEEEEVGEARLGIGWLFLWFAFLSNTINLT